jgi:hypothetical protein
VKDSPGVKSHCIRGVKDLLGIPDRRINGGKLKKRFRNIIFFLLFIIFALVGKMIRIYVFSLLGMECLNPFETRNYADSPRPNPIDGGNDSGGTLFDAINQFLPPNEAQAEERASSPLPPISNPAPEAGLPEIEEFDQERIWENLDAQERAAREQEDARIEREVEHIMSRCEWLERAMEGKAHRILRTKGITLDDPADVRRALNMALYDYKEEDIDSLLPLFKKLNRKFGKDGCLVWNTFIDELIDLGNTQVNARHKVD